MCACIGRFHLLWQVSYPVAYNAHALNFSQFALTFHTSLPFLPCMSGVSAHCLFRPLVNRDAVAVCQTRLLTGSGQNDLSKIQDGFRDDDWWLADELKVRHSNTLNPTTAASLNALHAAWLKPSAAKVLWPSLDLEV